jgi:hypothetical protein
MREQTPGKGMRYRPHAAREVRVQNIIPSFAQVRQLVALDLV